MNCYYNHFDMNPTYFAAFFLKPVLLTAVALACPITIPRLNPNNRNVITGIWRLYILLIFT